MLNFVFQVEVSDAGGASRTGRRGGQGVRGGGRSFSVSVFNLLDWCVCYNCAFLG